MYTGICEYCHLLVCKCPLAADCEDDETTLEQLEAKIRRAMFAHSEIIPRGFRTAAARAKIHAEIDTMLDQYALMASVAQVIQ